MLHFCCAAVGTYTQDSTACLLAELSAQRLYELCSIIEMFLQNRCCTISCNVAASARDALMWQSLSSTAILLCGTGVPDEHFLQQSQPAKLCTLVSAEARDADISVRVTTVLLNVSPSQVSFANRAYNFDGRLCSTKQ